MLFFLLAYLGGALTILSPCILPVLPFVFARAGRSFARSTLPMLAGMAGTFAIVATLAAFGGGWAVRANAIGRWAALGLLAVFGIALLFPSVSDRMTRPLVALGSRMSERQPGERENIWSSAVVGIATGLLWAPCAGPILGIIFTAAALNGASAGTTLLLLAYALGAATSLALALLVGGKVFARMKNSLGASERIRQVLGGLVLAGVVAIALGVDTRVLASLSSAQTAGLETALAQKLGVAQSDRHSATSENAMGDLELPVEGTLPAIEKLGIGPWLNSMPLTTARLRGKVVVIDFWTYSCINCLRSIPYVKMWDERYRKDGLVVIGVHAPEFAFEREQTNVAKAVKDLGIHYPVAMDNDWKLWRALQNNYWPAHYFVDAQGRVRYHHFGEGDYAKSERVIRQLLIEAGHSPTVAKSNVQVTGAQAAANRSEVRSPETYIGYHRADRFASAGGLVPDKPKTYSGSPLKLNQWSLEGSWIDASQSARSLASGAKISFRFHARDLHLGMGWTAFQSALEVHIDSVAPGSWTLDEYPKGFPTTLRRQFPAEPDFSELASFEWELSQAFVAGDALPVQMEQLKGIEWESARFELAPSFRLIHQETNAVEIWSALKHGRRDPARKTHKAPKVILVWRSDEICQFRYAERLEGTALELIATGASFGETCEAICTILGPDAAIEAAGKWLRQWLSDGYVARVASA